jgi:hypothetical protein
MQSVWLRFGPVPPMGGLTLCGVYRTWSDHDGRVFHVPDATARLEALTSQITRAAERYARVVNHGDLNLDLDWSGNPHYARRNLLATLLESTEAAGLKTHRTPPTWHSYGLHRVGLDEGGSRPGDGGDQPGSGGDRLGEGSSQPGDGGGQLGNGGDPRDKGSDRLGNGPDRLGNGQAEARCAHTARLDHVYTRGFPHATSRVLEDSTTDHRPVVTTIASGGAKKSLTKLNRRPFKAIRRRHLKQHKVKKTGRRYTPSRTWRRSTSSLLTASTQLTTRSPR